MSASRLENLTFERLDQWEMLADRKNEVLAVTSYVLFDKEKNMRWEWQYIAKSDESNVDKLKIITAVDEDL